MKISANTGYVKRTQKDYSVSFKLQIVGEIESGQLSRTEACHKYGIQAKSTIREWLRKYDPYENTIAEKINGILKQEFDIAKHICNIDIKKALIKNVIETYNQKRPHLSNHMLTPIQMHKQDKLKRKQYKSKKLINYVINQL